MITIFNARKNLRFTKRQSENSHNCEEQSNPRSAGDCFVPRNDGLSGLLLYFRIGSKLLFITSAVFVIISGLYAFSFFTGNSLPASQIKEIKVGVLLPLDGAAASIGEAAKAGLELAETDINSLLEKQNSDLQLKLIYDNTYSNPDSALSKVKMLAAKGIKVFIGSLTSGSVEKIKPYVDANDLVLLSSSSVATSLSVPNDNIFRLAPDDSRQVKAITALLKQDGIKYLISIYRDDVWGRDLAQSTKKDFEANGGGVLKQLSFDPNSSDIKSIMESVKPELNNAITKYGSKQVAIQFLSFSKNIEAFQQAANEQVFSQVKWYGGSASALNPDLLENKISRDFAQKVQFTTPAMGFEDAVKDKWEPLVKRIKAKIKKDPIVYSLTCYDAAWIITKAFEATKGAFEVNKFKSALVSTANNYTGVSGKTTLNAHGDRANATYDYWRVMKENNEYIWKRVGHFENGKISMK